MARVAEWLGAGVFTAGVSAALLAGAGAAQADTETGADTKASGTSDTSDSASAKSDSAKAEKAEKRKAARDDDSARADYDRPSRDENTSTTKDAAPEESDDDTDSDDTESEDAAAPKAEKRDEPAKRARTESAYHKVEAAEADVEATEATEAAEITDAAAPATEAQPIPVVGDIIGPFQPDYPPIVRAIGSAVFNFIGAIVQAADGPPVVPDELRDDITVSSSTLVISPGNEVAADWYVPTTGQPERLIYLQHGILASGPMYSYTAAYLAERTNSIVVATTITSNPFADGGLWLGGDNMHKAVAQLFLDDDRTALNASFTTATLKAGTPTLTVPMDFVLVGHSLGGGFAPGVAGHYAEGLVARRADGGDAVNHLAGLVLLDAVPFSPILPNAMDRLKELEDSNDGDPADYIPVYEIGAPLNYLNSMSAVDEELSDARPGKFNGVVINGGVHMDGMLGGNPLIQFAAYLVAGFPQPQNPPAVQRLMAGWINDMFDENIDPVTGRCLTDCEGIYGDPGATIVIPADAGEASAVVIDSGSLPAVTSLRKGRFVAIPVAV
jgi:pimeloyl-ACP methyl ester carboxylesterase